MLKKQVISKSALVPTVLISGGAGFIGSHLAETLLENKARVIVLDNFKTGKEIHVKHLLKDKNFALFDVDINESLPPEIESVDYIFHLAGLEEYLYSKEYLNLESLFTNSLGTKNLLDLARKSSAKFLLASTIDVYQGRMSQLYLDKYFGIGTGEENKFSLIEAKRFAEAVVWEYYKKHDTDARIVRLPEVYGPRMDISSSGFLGGFIKNLIDGASIEIYGEGTEKEYYLYVSDAVSGLVKAQFNPKTKGNIYSLVPEDPVSALEAAYLVKSLADAKLPVQFKPAVSDFKTQLKAPDTFNLKDLGWKPKVGLKEGVVRTLEFLGYSVNTHAFKPIKLVEEKMKSQQKLNEKLTSLQGLKNVSEVKEVKKEKPLYVMKKSGLKTARRSFHFSNLLNSLSPASVVSNIKTGARDFRFRVKADVGYGLSIFAILISAALVFVGIPAAGVYVNAAKGVFSLRKIEESVLQMKSEEINKETLSAYKGFKNARISLQKVRWLFKVLGKNRQFVSYDKLLGSLTSFSRAAVYASGAVKPLESVFETIRPDSTRSLDISLFDQAKLEVSNAEEYLKLAEADLYGVDPTMFPEKIKTELATYQNLLTEAQKISDFGFTIISDLPQILGSTVEKKYIFWFQNSNEIRPTGGFIGSYGILTFEKGKLKNLVIDDIYNPDGQIDVRNIEVVPPAPIKNFLGETKLYLRNSNWDPDFPRAAKTFDNLYFKINGDIISGYVALDLDFVKSLLKVTGPVFLAPYNEDISAGNLAERTQYYSGFDYKEGSADKKSFLTVLGSKLLERLFALKKENLPKLFGEIQKSLDQRHLMIYFSNSPVNALLKENGWDGSLVNTSGDYLYVVNSNLGGTKANYYVKNKITYEINSMTRDGLLRANLYLDYNHTGNDNSWPGGPYTDYVRVLSQNGSKLTGAKIAYSGGEETDIFKDIVVSKEGSYNSFETSFKIDPGNSVRLVFSYDLPAGLSLTKEFKKYNLVWQKQPGTSGDEFFFVFNPPFGTTVEAKSNTLSVTEGSVKSSGIFEKDLNYFILVK